MTGRGEGGDGMSERDAVRAHEDARAHPREDAHPREHGSAPPGASGAYDPDSEADIAEPPPFLGSWGRLYAAVILNLVLLILLFYAFRRAFEGPR